tara:strand:+ start:152 stop:2551 length:2400 start_codon:yes stop_codon:yes gene_type:complete
MKNISLLLMLTLLLGSIAPISSATSARSCSAAGDPSVNDITISPSGPLSMPADQSLNITAVAYNSAGTELNVPIAWSSTSGSIQNLGGGQARWSPQTVGPQSIVACNGDVQETLNVNVLPGAPILFELSVPQENYSADDTFEITPQLRDQFGNAWVPNIPYANWTLPDGMDISLPNDGTPPIITPGPVGEMAVEVNWDEWQDSVSFNVSRGVAVGVSIIHESAHISSDDIVELCAHHHDQRGNTWLANTTWSTQGGSANDALSSFAGECVDFDADSTGDWTVEIEDIAGLSDSLTLTVSAGRLAQISLDNLSKTMHIGEFYLLEANGFDAAGNPVNVDSWNWSVSAGPSSDAIVAEGDGMTFVPDLVGQHTIQVTAAGRVQAIDVEVLAGVPVELEIEVLNVAPGALNIVTGSSLDLILYGVDSSGNRNPVDAPISDWFVLNEYGVIENASVGGTGHYTYTSSGIGDVSITVFLDQAQGTLLVHVLQGPLDYLEVNLPKEADQGTTVRFDVAGFDMSGNPVSIHQCSATITTDAGEAECDTNGWALKLKQSGELAVHARIQSSVGTSAEGTDFISVQPTWFGWGNNTQVIIAFSFIIVLVISAILVMVFRHLDLRISEESEEEEEVAPVETLPAPPIPVSAIGGMPPPLPAAALPPTPQQVPAVTIQPNFIATPNPLPPIQSEPVVAQPTPPPVEMDEEDWAAPQPEVQLEPELPTQSDDEWGEMSQGWGDDETTLVAQAQEYSQQQHEIRRGEGPRNTEGHSLRPLPGTDAGQDGWYFDREGKPTLWHHNETSGWSQE